MLVGYSYRFRAGVDQRAGQGVSRPGSLAGFTFQGHWTMADGMGGMFIAEVDSAAAAFEASATFADQAEFQWSRAGRHGVGADQRAGVRLDRLGQLTFPTCAILSRPRPRCPEFS